MDWVDRLCSWLVCVQNEKTKSFDDIEIEHNVQNWITFDSKTGQQISSAGDGSIPLHGWLNSS